MNRMFLFLDASISLLKIVFGFFMMSTLRLNPIIGMYIQSSLFKNGAHSSSRGFTWHFNGGTTGPVVNEGTVSTHDRGDFIADNALECP